MDGVSESTHRARIQTDNPGTTRVNQPGREEAVVRVGEQPVQHERPEDWGWHHQMGSWGRKLVVLPLIFLVAMLFGNHRGRIEDVWLIGISVAVVLFVLWDWRRRKNAWRSE
jgi:hypothetical protein